jgi:hypothetical protein
MRLISQGSQFVFNLPSDFLTQEVISTYKPMLEKNWVDYENVIDYLNSTIKGIDFPGIRFDTPKQTIMRGKTIAYKPSVNVQDIARGDINITFASVDSHLNYFLLYDMIIKHYLDTENLFINPFMMTALDIHRDAIYRLKFYQVIIKSLSDNRFDYSQQKIGSPDFTMVMSYNFYDIEFLLDRSKVLELADVPMIIQKI